ncbi:MAG: hypothetical protein ACYSUB_14745 [Planctomycetota bacterium]
MNLARYWEQEPTSTREVAREKDISYQLMCKIQQKLHNARLVESCMGPKEGLMPRVKAPRRARDVRDPDGDGV